MSSCNYERDRESQLLHELDECIESRSQYHALREHRIDSIKNKLRNCITDSAYFEECGRLVEEYRSYDLDSQLYYTEERLRIASTPFEKQVSLLNYSEVMMRSGMYHETILYMDSALFHPLDPVLDPYYSHLRRTLYGLMADFSISLKEKQHYTAITQQNRLLMMSVHPEGSFLHELVRADYLRVAELYDSALHVMDSYEAQHPIAGQDEEPIFAFTRAQIYHKTGDKQQEKHYLLISALADLRNSIREYIALRELAILLYEEGNIDHAYRYMQCAMEDASKASARVRSIEMNTVFPVVEQAYLQQVHRRQYWMLTGIISSFILLIVLIIFFLYVTQKGRQLSVLNERLEKSNEELRESNRIKDAYVGRYMETTSLLIDHFDNYRKQLKSLAHKQQFKQLTDIVDSQRFTQDQLNAFYADFDEAFLELFPNFVNDVKSLLVPEADIHIKEGERLNTDLRVLALIRLGITDSKQIANFLRYSLSTIYNSRTRMRNLYTAEIKLTQTHEYYIDFFDDKWSVEHYGNNPSNSSIPGTGYASTLLGKNNLRPLIVNYYDDYDYIAKREPTAIRPQLRFSQESGYGLQHDNAIGLLTGTRIYNLSEEGYTAYSYYYDIKGRVIQNRSMQNVTNGYKTSTSTEYLFDGSIAQQLTEQGKGNNLVREHYRYSYDHAGRALKTYYQLNNDDEIQLSSFSYDSIGRLAQNLLHNSVDSIRYSYDMRNMLTATKNKHFSEDLFYADSVSSFVHATPCYNGNIAVARTLLADTSFTFVYSYDQLNRLVESEQDAGDHTKPSEWFRYDDRGNIRQLQRYSGDRLIDDLHFSYQEDGNQLLSITDDGEDADLYSTIEYHNADTQADTTMFYDANGNLIHDLDRGISAIRYNILNLPDTILFANGNRIVNLYDAAGHKYKSIVYTVPATAVTASYDLEHVTFEPDSMEYRITEYNGNIETCYTPHDTTIRIFNSIGYWADSAYFYTVKDHLGNICAVVNANADTVVQRTMYYASGVPMAQSWGRETQPYLYNGKEFIEAHGLNEYDSQARMYYAPIMRTTTIDPYAEKYYHISPYAWCGNNPIGMVDKNGKYYYDWKNSCYRSSYGDHEEVEWSTIVANRFTEQAPNNELTPLHSVKEFITGRAPLERNLSENDEFVKQIKKSSRLKGIYRKIAKAIANGIESSSEDQNENYNFSLGDDKLLQIFCFAQDVATTYATIRYGDWAGNLVGNMAASVMGSFEFSWEKTGVDYNGNAIVVCHLSNPMSANSLLKVPLIGYTDFWRENVGNKINAYFNSEANEAGIMQTVNINMTWTEIIPKSN